MERDLYTLAEVAEMTAFRQARCAVTARPGPKPSFVDNINRTEMGDSTKPLTEQQRRQAAMASTRAANVARMRRGAA